MTSLYSLLYLSIAHIELNLLKTTIYENFHQDIEILRP